MNLLDVGYMTAAVLLAPVWAKKRRAGWAQRLGKIPPVGPRQTAAGGAASPRILLHAVSVGEVGALRELVPILTARGAHVIISVGTDTGIKRARELFSASCDVVRYPLDFSWSVRRFLRAVRPDVVGLVELEIWPNFVSACERLPSARGAGQGIPVCIINGRLSQRSFRGYSRLRPFFRRSFGALAAAAVQDEDYARRFIAMGVPPDRCRVTGSMKWDSATIEDGVPGAAELAGDMGIARGPGSPPLIVAGSTGPGEESLLAAACDEIERQIGPVQLLCAPRKPERFDEAAQALDGCIRRSRASAPDPRSRRFLLDTIGELRKAYTLADVVVVGRSFGDQYGSDPIEPIALGKATIIGPAVSDFARIVAAFESGGGILRADRATLATVLRDLLTSEPHRTRVASRGREVIRAMQGASARHAELLLGLAAPALTARPSAPEQVPAST